MTIDIEKGIPMPRGAPGKYPWLEMQIGDSFVTDHRGRAAAANFKYRHPGWNYRIRTLPDGRVRLWRTA